LLHSQAVLDELLHILAPEPHCLAELHRGQAGPASAARMIEHPGWRNVEPFGHLPGVEELFWHLNLGLPHADASVLRSALDCEQALVIRSSVGFRRDAIRRHVKFDNVEAGAPALPKILLQSLAAPLSQRFGIEERLREFPYGIELLWLGKSIFGST
jgi:hypothetical protein